MAKDYDIVVAFQNIEEELINSMLRNIKRHTDWEKTEGFEWSMWQAEQLMALEKYRSANMNKFNGYFSTINDQIEEVLEKAYEEGNMQQEIEILSALREGYIFKKRRKGNLTVSGEFLKVNNRKLDALIKATRNDFQKAQFSMLRMANDQYRKIIFNAQVYANTGAATIEKAIDMATKDYIANGINCIEYKNGSRVNVVRYVDMAIRTANKRAYLQGEGDKRKEWGISTVIVATRGKGCPKCVPHQGKIYIDDVWSGGSSKDGPYPLLSAAIEKGLYHPNCRDTHTTYFDGITTKPIKPTKEQQEENIKEYNREQKQRYLERLTEKYKNLEERSFDKENKQKYKAKKESYIKFNNIRDSSMRDTKNTKIDKEIKKSEVDWNKYIGVDINISTKLNEIHNDLNEVMRKEKREKLVVLSTEERVVKCSQKGKIDEIVLSKEAVNTLKKSQPNDIIFIHNHPTPTTFSKYDIQHIIRHESIKSLTLECIDGTKYFIDRGTFKSSMLKDFMFMGKYEKIYNEIAEKYPELNDEVKIYDVWDKFLHDVNKSVAEYYGFIYKKVE